MKHLFFITLFISTLAAAQDVKKLHVKINKPMATVSPTMWGVFFEDINLGADGGIYAELIKNRSFEFTRPLMGWKILGKPLTEGDFTILNRSNENTNNPRYLRVLLHNNKKGSIGLQNEGFRGMGIKKELRYDFSLMYRQQSGTNKLYVELVKNDNTVIGSTTVDLNATGEAWKKVSAGFNATDTALKAKLNIWFEGDSTIDLDMISLFPTDTWKNRPGGMRADMVQWLADMKPGFIRFPGGCIVEGFDLAHRYQWKKTIGPVEERQLIMNRWNNEFAHRPTPDYFQTFGLGFYEYFQLAEDIGAEPLPILNCGMACQFNSAELASIVELDPYVQDALDLIEFANGDASTLWGKQRAAMGHPAPFNLKMLGVGNENWGPQYIERLKIFKDAIKSKYPAIKIVTSSGTDPDGERFDYLNRELRNMEADIIDEHYYRKPEWFFNNARRYDNYPRNNTKIFCGEYAAQSTGIASPDNKNNWLTALSEAAFMTGLERNADVVTMASYAPLFAHVDGWQWTPDLIWVNNLQSYGTPDYYVQKLFATNKGNKVVPVLLNDAAVAGDDSLYASAVIDTAANELIIKVVNASAKPAPVSIALEGAKSVSSNASLTVLSSDDTGSVNSFENPKKVHPVDALIRLKGKKIEYSIRPYSMNVIKIKM